MMLETDVKASYRTSPDQETRSWPPGIAYIVGNEACERFSFYGMRAILYIHLVSLYVIAGALEEDAKNLSTSTVHLFNTGVYALPMIGAIIADRLAGKYRTILYLSLVYCLGHAVLAIGESSLSGMYLGLGLIAVGSGGIKPCVSANVGDQFGRGNWFRVRTIYQIFYFSINFGSFFATILIPRVKEYWGPALARSFPFILERTTPERFGTSLAFAIPGILMFIATFLFWLGRKKFVHVPPNPGGKIGLYDSFISIAFFMVVGHLFFTAALLPWWALLGISSLFLLLGFWLFSIRQQLAADDGFLAITLYALREYVTGRTFDRDPAPPEAPPLACSRLWGPAVEKFGLEATEGPVAVFKIISVFFLISVFWALFDQHSSSWIRQAAMMDLTLWGERSVLPSEIPSMNPLMVMLLIPSMNAVYALCDRLGLKTTPLRRITAGMLVAALSFAAVALLQQRIDAEGEGKVWFAWQIIPYLLITIAEVMVSITGLEFAYTQAPKRMKSMVMGFWLLTVALGNVLVALLARFSDLKLADFFWLFAALMGGAGVLFGIRSYFYVQKDYTQE